ncbi:MAG: hypothetical protein AB2704_26055 [Candidatus Thiodiazotropha taylori]
MESDNELSHEQLEALRVQLTELNNRGRWYSSQLWQVPFAYLGITGLLLSQIKLAETQTFILIVVSVAFLGAFVIAHMNGIADGEKRAVKDLQNTETSLGIPQTALYRPN